MPPVIGRGAPVVPGNVIGSPLSERTAEEGPDALRVRIEPGKRR